MYSKARTPCQPGSRRISSLHAKQRTARARGVSRSTHAIHTVNLRRLAGQGGRKRGGIAGTHRLGGVLQGAGRQIKGSIGIFGISVCWQIVPARTKPHHGGITA